MSGGVAVFDSNGAGRPDLYFTHGAEIPSLEKPSPRSTGGSRGPGLLPGSCAGDYDNDGYPDVL